MTDYLERKLKNRDYFDKPTTTVFEKAPFIRCYNLESVTIPDSVKSIGGSAFMYSSLKSAVVPYSVTEIGNNAFKVYSGLTIYGYANTYAQTYAVQNNIPFTVIGEIVIGDTNADGNIDVRDVTAIQRHLDEFETFNRFQLVSADTNRDGVVNIEDATLLQMYLAEFDVSFG